MRAIALVLSLAVSSIALSSDFTPAFATKMNGKGSPSSDGGRSYRYKMAMLRRAMPHTCTAYAASCFRVAYRRGDDGRMCVAAKAQCLRSGIHVGPYSHMQIAGMEKR